MKRYDAIQLIMKHVGNEPVICNIGDPSKELYNIEDRNENFYMLGSMGLVSSIGLGVAIASGLKTIIIDGDGSILMNMGSLATIANSVPKPNLLHICFDNKAYGSTGYQKTMTAGVTDLKKIAEGSGITRVYGISGIIELENRVKEELNREGTCFMLVEVEKKSINVPIVPLDSELIKRRFMKSLQKNMLPPPP